MATIKKWKPDGTNTAYPVTNSKAVVYVEESDASTTKLINDKVKETDAQIATKYDETATYNANDVVRYNGILYKCLADSTTGVVPTTTASWSNYNNIAPKIAGLEPRVTDLETNVNNINASIASAYSATSSYAVDDVVWHEGVLYKCNTAITTAEAWTASKWTAIDELAPTQVDLKAKVDETWESLAADYSASATYKVGDVVKKDKVLYICNTAITTAEAFDATHWTDVATNHALIPSADNSTLEKDVNSVVSVKDEGVTVAKLEQQVQSLLAIMSNFIEVQETGWYIVDGNLNIGHAVETPTCFGLGLANEDV